MLKKAYEGIIVFAKDIMQKREWKWKVDLNKKERNLHVNLMFLEINQTEEQKIKKEPMNYYLMLSWPEKNENTNRRKREWLAERLGLL